MPYATQQDLVDSFGSQELIELTDRTNVPPTTIDANVVTKALADASSVMDGYLAGAQILLPIVSPPPELNRYCRDIARKFLYSATQPTDIVQQNYTDAIAYLKAVANGTVKLQVAGIATPGDTDTIVTSGPPRALSRDRMRSF